MIAPNKAVSIHDSALGHAKFILAHGPEPIHIGELYEKTGDHFESIDHFLLTLDLLYVLEKIEVNLDTQILSYA